MANFNIDYPPSRTDLLERDKNGRFTGKMGPVYVRWFSEFVTAMKAFVAMIDAGAVASQFDTDGGVDQDARSTAGMALLRESWTDQRDVRDTAEMALLRDSESRVVVEGEPAGLFHVERVQEGPGLAEMLALFSGDRSANPVVRILSGTAANLTLYPAAQYPEAIYLETDTNLWRYSAAGAWVQFGTFDDAYGVGWNASTKAPTQNAVYDKIELVVAAAVALISDAAYGAGWDGVTTIAPSKNAVYDQMQLKLTANGINFGPAAVASITIVNGQVTAVS